MSAVAAREAPTCYDVLVVGTGPAGLATAIFAAQAGYSVAVLDAQPAGGQPKACGEGLMPAGVAALGRLGVLVAPTSRMRITGVAYQTPSQRVQADFAPTCEAWGLARAVLNDRLRARARELEVAFVPGRLLSFVESADNVQVVASTGPLQARFIAGADGLHSRTRALAGLERPARGIRRFGLRRHLPQAPWSSCVEVYLGALGEAYVTPVDAQTVNVAFLSEQPKLSWAGHLAHFPTLARRLDNAACATAAPARGAGPFFQRVSACARGRIALVGDAAGYVDAVTGEGVSLALLAAEAFVLSLAATQPSLSYARAMRGPTRHYAWHARALLFLTRRRWLRGPALWLLGRVPTLLNAWVAHAVQLPVPKGV